MSNSNSGIRVQSYKDSSNIAEASSRNYIESFLKPKLLAEGFVSRSISELQNLFGICSPNYLCKLACEYGINVKIQYGSDECCYSFWYD